MIEFKIGFSKDIHKIQKTADTNNLVLGGFKFQSNYKIIAHSDGDLIIHSIVDAILDALFLEDIGFYFSDKEEINKGRSSLEMLNFALEKMKEQNFNIKQISLTIFSNYINIQKIKTKILDSLKLFLGLQEINIKGRHFEVENNTIECYCNLILIK